MSSRNSRRSGMLTRHLSQQRNSRSKSDRTMLLKKATADISQWSTGLPSPSRGSRSMTQNDPLSRSNRVSRSRPNGITKHWDPLSRSRNDQRSRTGTRSRGSSRVSCYSYSGRGSVPSMDLEMQDRRSRAPLPRIRHRGGGACGVTKIIMIVFIIAGACVIGYFFLPEQSEEDKVEITEVTDQCETVVTPAKVDRPNPKTGLPTQRELISVGWSIQKKAGYFAMINPMDQQFWRHETHSTNHEAYHHKSEGMDADGLLKEVSSRMFGLGTPDVGFDDGVLRKFHAEVEASTKGPCDIKLSDARKKRVKDMFSKWFDELKSNDHLTKNAVAWVYHFHFKTSEMKKSRFPNAGTFEYFKFGQSLVEDHRFMAGRGNGPAMIGYIVRLGFKMFDTSANEIWSKCYEIGKV